MALVRYRYRAYPSEGQARTCGCARTAGTPVAPAVVGLILGLRRSLGRSAVAAICLMFVAVFLGASTVPQPAQPAQLAQPPLRVIQLNLCGSGIADCYTDQSVSAAAAVIRARTPDVVTLNEVCRDHVDVLATTLTDVFGTGRVVSAFTALTAPGTGSEVRCRTGQPFGVGMVARVPASGPSHLTDGGIYPAQDPDDSEQRAWLCLDALTGFVACTTHLTNMSPAVALAQCGHLLHTAIPSIRTRSGGDDPVVIAGDLNLRDGGSSDLGSCLPSGYLHAGDGHVQHVVTTANVAIDSAQFIDMAGTTDHPALLVTLRRLR